MKKFIGRCLCSVSLVMILLLASCSNETSNSSDTNNNNNSKQRLYTVVQGDTEFNHLDLVMRTTHGTYYHTEDGRRLIVSGTYYEIEEEK